MRVVFCFARTLTTKKGDCRMISIIAALAQNGVIGKNNAMPWNLPGDFQWFLEKTFGKQLVVGRKTFESIEKKPLPDRTHVVLTTMHKYVVPADCTLAHSIEDALKLMPYDQETMICGGAIVYRQFLPLADRMYLTHIHHSFEGDVFFPKFSFSKWREIAREESFPDKENAYAFSIVTLEKRKS